MKKKLLKSTLLAVTGVALLAGSAAALPVGTALQDAINIRSTNGSSSVNVQTDMVNDANDSAWSITATGGSISTLLFEFAGYAGGNSFGIYELNNTSNYLELFTGASAAVSKASLLYNHTLGKYSATMYDQHDNFVSSNFMMLNSDNFGFYLNVADTNTRYYSDTARNVDSSDHMLAYKGKGEGFDIYYDELDPNYVFNYSPWAMNEYILAWEDLYRGLDGNGNYIADDDFTDFVVMVESVQPVPEPSTMILFGAGLIGLAGVARRKKAKK